MFYSLLTSTITVEQTTTDTYGICGNGVEVKDISLNKDEVVKLLNKINEIGDVEPIHLFEICEDYVETLA